MGRTFEQTVHVFDGNANIANGGDSAQDSPLDEAPYGDRMNVQNLGRFGQGVNTRRKFHKQEIKTATILSSLANCLKVYLGVL